MRSREHLQPRAVLVAVSFLGLLMGIASTAGGRGMADSYGIIGTALRDPIAPLLLSLACAAAFVACGAESSRRMRPAVVVWWSVIVAALLFAIAGVFFDSAPRD